MFDQSKGYDILGKGGQAIVISAYDNSGKKVAIKKPMHPSNKVQNASGIINMKELYILANIKHPYIQSASQIYFTDPFPTSPKEIDKGVSFDRVFFVMDMAEYSVHELVHKKTPIISNIKRAMFQVTCAVQYLHGQGICHRDIKPGNILCYFNRGVLTCRLADFGMTKPLNTFAQNSLHAGTAYYRAPEIIMQNRHYGYPMDVWSLGCTFFEMVTRRPMFEADTEIQVLMKIFKLRGSPSEDTMNYICSDNFKVSAGNYKPCAMYKLLNLTPNQKETFTTKNDVYNSVHNPGTIAEFCSLMDDMMVIDPRNRADMDRVLLHDFFKGHFEEHSHQHGLWKPDRSTINSKHRLRELGNTMLTYPDHHDRKLWESGLKEISEMDKPHSFYTTEVSYSIKFLGADIYNRVLSIVKAETLPINYRKLAWCSAYIASKYYLDEGSAHLWDLFPISPSYMNAGEIQATEKRIIQILDCKIYRPNLFTFIENPCFYSSLYLLTMYPDFIYGKKLIEVMNAFNYRVSKYKNDNPGYELPL